MYRFRLIEKKQFVYQSVTYYQDIRKMHELQEEYLLIVHNDINCIQDLLDSQNSIKMRRSEIVGEQRGLYKQHSVGKKVVKIKKDFDELYDEFGKKYEASVVEKGYERKKGDKWK